MWGVGGGPGVFVVCVWVLCDRVMCERGGCFTPISFLYHWFIGWTSPALLYLLLMFYREVVYWFPWFLLPGCYFVCDFFGFPAYGLFVVPMAVAGLFCWILSLARA